MPQAQGGPPPHRDVCVCRRGDQRIGYRRAMCPSALTASPAMRSFFSPSNEINSRTAGAASGPDSSPGS